LCAVGWIFEKSRAFGFEFKMTVGEMLKSETKVENSKLSKKHRQRKKSRQLHTSEQTQHSRII
jgi:hypothetical protein